MDIKEKISLFPDSAGVYLMKDSSGRIIYIGKALSLRKRLSSYLARGLSAKTLRLMANVADIEYRTTATEGMALLLEASLIKEHKPKYNVSLRDDKSFPLVKVTHEEFPAIYVTRKKEDDGAKYFGPYTNAALLREALKIIRRNFPYRSCPTLPKKACMYYRIKLSPAPCIGKISKSDYAKTLKQISLILEGKSEELVKELSREMRQKAKERKFEEAALLRDKMIALNTFRPSLYNAEAALNELREVLRLPVMPRRIEAFDVSNILGRQATASMVSFYNGLADKDNYRRFRIKTVKQSDDYKMMAEAVHRRYLRLKEENLPLPDLILVDGGRGQLCAAKKELEGLGLVISIVSLAKREEEIYTLFIPRPIRLKNNSSALRLLQCIRDESHRFALKYHRLLRKKRFLNEEKSG